MRHINKLIIWGRKETVSEVFWGKGSWRFGEMGMKTVSGLARKTCGLKSVLAGPWYHHHHMVLRKSLQAALASAGNTRRWQRSRSLCSQLFYQSWVGTRRAVMDDTTVALNELSRWSSTGPGAGGQEGERVRTSCLVKVLLQLHPQGGLCSARLLLLSLLFHSSGTGVWCSWQLVSLVWGCLSLSS